MHLLTRASLGFGIVVCLCSAPVLAYPVTVEIDSTITQFVDPTGAFGITAHVGDSLTLDYTYETTTPGVNNRGDEAFSGALTALSYRVGTGAAQSLQLTQSDIQYQFIGIYTQQYNLTATAHLPGVTANPVALQFYDLLVGQPLGPHLFTSSDLSSPPNFPVGGYTMYMSGGTSSLNTNVTNVHVVPLPGAIWLLGSGLLGFFGALRKREQLGPTSVG